VILCSSAKTPFQINYIAILKK